GPRPFISGGTAVLLKLSPSCENGTMTGVRMDKWLWAARFFKTRSLATRACELGRIASNGQRAKASREVRVGDLLQVKNDAGEFQVEVVLLSETRGPAEIARTLYRETEMSRELRRKLSEERKTMPHFEASQEGRPSKRDRRVLDRFRGRVWPQNRTACRASTLAVRLWQSPPRVGEEREPGRPAKEKKYARIFNYG